MAQRLSVPTEKMKEVVKRLSSFYTPSKLYNYSNFVTLEVIEGMLCFDMCIIIGEATNNALVTTWFEVGADDDIPPMALSYDLFSSFVKVAKAPTIDIVLNDNSVQLTSGTTTHTLEASTIRIPNKIVESMEYMRGLEGKELDFSGKKLYNNIRTAGDFLTMNTLNFSLYGIMATKDGTFATNGFVLARYVDDTFNEIDGDIFFPAYLKPILSSLANEQYKVKVDNKLVYLKGKNFEFYFEEWMNKKDYPMAKLKTILSTSLTPIVEDTKVFVDALNEAAMFGDIIRIDLENGRISNKEGTHVITIKEQKGMGMLALHTDLIPKDSIKWESIEVDSEIPRLKFISNTLTKLVMGMTNGTN